MAQKRTDSQNQNEKLDKISSKELERFAKKHKIEILGIYR
ncbi:MAG: hypothetical protein ACI840_002573 [Ulvibacter sp.]|jgi:hypothetical protein